MKTKIEVELKPFDVPHYAATKPRLFDVEDEPRKFHLKELDENTLHKLCEEFTNEVFKIAGKNRPPLCA